MADLIPPDSRKNLAAESENSVILGVYRRCSVPVMGYGSGDASTSQDFLAWLWDAGLG